MIFQKRNVGSLRQGDCVWHFLVYV